MKMQNQNNSVFVNFCLNFETIKLNTLENLCYKIYPNRVKTADKLCPSKRKIHLAAFLLAWFCIKNQFQISNLSFFKINGKPFIKNQNAAFFNISHTQNAIACATANCPVGIDIEKIRPINLKLAKKIYCKNEIKQFLKLTSTTQKTNHFFRVWTLKESFAKMKAESIFKNLKSVACKNIKNSKTLEIKSNFRKFVLSVCTKSNQKILISKINFKKIINLF